MNLNTHAQSIRWRLPLTYSGIALLTTIALGVALLLPLRGYYLEREQNFLQRNADAIAEALAPLLAKGDAAEYIDLNEQIKFLAMLSQVRVRLIGADQQQIVDSGPWDRDVLASVTYAVSGSAVSSQVVREMVSPISEGEGRTVFPQPTAQAAVAEKILVQGSVSKTGGADKFWVSLSGETVSRPVEKLQLYYEPSVVAVQGKPVLVSVVPMAGTMYGFELQREPDREDARSDQVLRRAITAPSGLILGWVELSGGPAYGHEIVTNVAGAWLVASLIAVIVAGSVGWWISRRMTVPLLALTAITQRMSEGDLAARADIRRRDEIGSLGRSFNEMADRVESTISALRRFASDAAHELHTPLTALRTNLELASTAPQPAEYLRRAGEQLQRMEDLTIDLLDLSRIETGTLELVFEPLLLGNLLRQTCEPFASQAEQAGLLFALDLPENDITIDGNRGQIQRAVTNLVENALKFTPLEGAITVGLRPVGDEARIWVEDSGIGIAADDLPLLFNRFHRGCNASSYPGSGLGLSIVRAIATRHGGRVWVKSKKGKTRFTLALPIY